MKIKLRLSFLIASLILLAGYTHVEKYPNIIEEMEGLNVRIK